MKKLFLCLFIYLSNPGNVLSADDLIFSVAPQRSASELARLWIPLFKVVEKQSDIKISFSTAPEASSFYKRLSKGNADVVFVDPYSYASLPQGLYEAVAKPNVISEFVHPNYGLIVVRQQSPYQSLDDLVGQKISFPSPQAFSASILPRYHMKATGVSYKAQFSYSDISSALSVVMKLSEAAGMEASIFNSLPDHLKNELRVVWTTTPSDLCKAMRNHPFVFAVKQNLPQPLKDKIKHALLSVSNTKGGKDLLANLGFSNIVAATTSEWVGLNQFATAILTE